MELTKLLENPLNQSSFHLKPYTNDRKTTYVYDAIYSVNVYGSGSPVILNGILRCGAHFKGFNVIFELLTFKIAQSLCS